MRSACLALLLLHPQGGAPAKVDFVRDVQPILRDACLKCHGEKRPKGQLRLDARLHAMKGGVSGPAILPGKGAESLLVKVLLDPDEEVRMPQKAEPLPAAKIDVLRRWIDEGAVWPDAAAGDATVEIHWAYVKPLRREPAVAAPNPIDGFVRARLAKEGLAPSPEADRPTLIRRLSYDLLGLPPSPEEVDAFAGDPAPDAYERLVDRLLASPHYGERWGRHWLDKARYADSDGYEKDSHRPDAWRFRDWVIDALNDDMPFDRFTTEQLAGDLLPGAGPMQVLATAFHRQTLTNNEGGVDKEQFRVEAVFDRTETTATVWLGLTVGCARCHNHKYDAISQQEYYRLYAFFDNADETTAEVPVSEEAAARYLADKAEHDRVLRELEGRLAKERPALVELLPSWETGLQAKLRQEREHGIRFEPLKGLSIRPVHEVTFAKQKDGSWLAGGADAATETYTITAEAPGRPVTGLRLEVLPDRSLPKQGPGRSAGGNFVLSEIRLEGAAWKRATASFSQKGWDVKGAIDGDPKTGWAVAPQSGKPHEATFVAADPLPGDGPLVITLDQQYGDRHTIGRFRILAMTGTTPPLDLPDPARKALAKEADKRSDYDREALLELVALEAPSTKALAKQIREHRAREPKPPAMQARVLAQRTKDPRVTKLFHRGEFLQPKQEVAPGTLASLNPFEARGTEPDRLDLARWLFHRDNPLTARVAANHVWALLFGHGLVRTANDFGVRGDPPTHPELLDWLATEYVRLGWSQKALIRRIATSATYRQSSRHRPEALERDAQNFLLHRQNRFRVEAEIVRDLALAAGGVLSRKIGGPSVYPPLPPDIAALSYANNFKWKTSEGEDRYRRGMYTYFKRTTPYPGLMTFDCPDSNTTCVQRRASNTPLQALTLLNNEVFVEAAQAFGRRIAAFPGDDDARLARAFKTCTARTPTAFEAAQLRGLLDAARAHPGAEDWTVVARILLNLDEFLTRE